MASKFTPCHFRKMQLKIVAGWKIAIKDENLDEYRNINPKSIKITYEFYEKIDYIEKLFDQYDPSIITFDSILIYFSEIKKFE